MSDSDSENEYASADEDTEENSSRADEAQSSTILSQIQNIESGDSKSYKENEIKNVCSDKLDSLNSDNIEKKIEDVLTIAENSEPLLENKSNVEVTHTIQSYDQMSPKPSSKRVTLLLERKMQKRNQSLSSESANSELKEDKTVSTWGFSPSTDSEPKIEEKPVSTWGFSSWGSSLLSTAASSVTTFTSQVSQGFGTVLETVETSLGALPPEDLAAILKEKREKELLEAKNNEEIESEPKMQQNVEKSVTEDEPILPSMLLTGVSSLTKVVGDTGSKVLMGGLDTLELIGKKTMDILTEGDPGLRRKRSAFTSGVTLSQVLREAKEKAEKNDNNASTDEQEDAVHYTRFFDEYQGLVHLEALEMLSNQCQSKVQRSLLLMSGDCEEKYTIEKITRICEDLPSADETPDVEIEEDFNASISDHIQSLQIKINIEKIEMVRNEINKWLKECIIEQDKGTRKEAKDIYREAIRSLSEFTAKCVEQFHKIGELIMIQHNDNFDILMCATHLTGLTSVLSSEVSVMATKYCQCLNTAADDSEDPDSITPLITNVYLEASNSTTYIQDAFQLLIPVLQSVLVE